MADSTRTTILLVEDEAITAMAEAATLERHGYAVITAHSGEEAIEALAGNPSVDLVLMDVDLGPGIDGPATAEKMLDQRDIPVLFLSSHTEPEIVEKTERITSYGYVVKHSGVTVLLASIRLAFRLHRAQLSIRSQKRDLQSAIEELEATNEELVRSWGDIRASEEALRMQYDLSLALNTCTDLMEALGLVLDTVLKFECIDSGGVYLADPETGALDLAAHRGMSPDFIARVTHFDADSTNVRLALAGEVRYIHYDEIRPNGDAIREKESLLHLAFIPVFHQGSLIATLNLASHTHDSVPGSVRPVLESLALQIGGALVRIRSIAKEMESRERHRSLIENLPIGIFRTTPGPRGQFIMANSAFARMCGYDSVDEVLALDVAEVYADRSQRAMISDELERHGQFEGKNVLFRRKDGSTFIGSVSTRAFGDPDGAARHFDGWMIDITDRLRVEEALAHERWRLSSIIEGTNIGTWEWNVRTGATNYNERWAEIIGQTLDELSPVSIDTWKRFTHPDDLAKSEELLKRHFSGELPYYECECRMRHREGNWVWVLDRGRVITRTPEGEPLMMYGTHTDITGLKETEEKLRESKELLELFFSQSLHGFFFMMLDEAVEWNDGTDKEKALDYIMPHQRITRVNRAMADQYRANDVADLLGLTSQDLFAHDPELGRRTFHRLFDRGHWHMETDERRLDGSQMWTEGDYICLYDSMGRITGHFGVQMDVTERRISEKALRDSEARFRIFAELAPVGIVIADRDARTIFVSQNFIDLFGYTIEDMPSVDAWWPLAYPDEAMRERIRRDWTSSIDEARTSGGDVPPREYPVTCRDGIVRMIEFRTRIAADMIIVLFADVTQRKKAEERIQTLLEEKELFLRETHHRVKNNLGVIQSLLNLQSNEQKDGAAGEILADAAGRVQSMAVLYDRLYRSDIHHELSLKKYLPPLIKEIIGVFHTQGPVKTHLRIDDIVLSAGKLSPIGIIINELITNSMKHAFPDSRGGRITVTAAKKGNAVAITYADSGPGLPNALSFENSPTFGLQLVRLLVAQLGGTISIEKKKGTKYVISFTA
ncbi:MAG: PAS domain S-box protein [Spirochaetes bacterium]|nr:PAS domain S-box protein [Spirochaetota bacterium]